MLRTCPPDPVPGLEDFFDHFLQLFGSRESTAVSEDLAVHLYSSSAVAFTTTEVSAALGMMAQGKSAGNAVYSLDVFHSGTLSLY